MTTEHESIPERRDGKELSWLRQAVDASGEIVFMTDCQGLFTFVNATFEQHYGYLAAEVIGRMTPRILQGPTASPEEWAACWQQLASGGVVESTFVNATRDGRLLEIEATARPLLDDAGTVVGHLFVHRDATARKRADQERSAGGASPSVSESTPRDGEIETLRIAEERMRLALRSADVGIWDLDYTTGVLRWSDLIEAHYGLEPGAFTGTFEAFIERIHPDDRVAVLETIAKATRFGTDFSVHNRTIWPDGTVRWLTNAGRVFLSRLGKPIRAVGISMDGTARKKLELELLQSQKLESVGRLASGVAHEINTPVQFVSDSVHFVHESLADLTNLIGTYRDVTALVLAGLPAQSAAEASRQAEQDMDLDYALANVTPALDRSIEGLNRVTGIVRSMKEFAHPGRPEMAAVDLNRSIQSTLTIALGEYKHVADIETHFGDVPLVTCHGGEVNQVVLNLIVNAAHAIGDTFTGTGLKGRIVIDTHLDDDTVVVRIADNGGGIPDAIRDRVFDPFFTTKDVGKGTGQGLSMARRVIVEKHGGELTFESRVGDGTTFTIRLPIRHSREAASELTAQS